MSTEVITQSKTLSQSKDGTAQSNVTKNILRTSDISQTKGTSASDPRDSVNVNPNQTAGIAKDNTNVETGDADQSSGTGKVPNADEEMAHRVTQFKQ